MDTPVILYALQIRAAGRFRAAFDEAPPERLDGKNTLLSVLKARVSPVSVEVGIALRAIRIETSFLSNVNLFGTHPDGSPTEILIGRDSTLELQVLAFANDKADGVPLRTRYIGPDLEPSAWRYFIATKCERAYRLHQVAEAPALRPVSLNYEDPGLWAA